MKPIRSIFLLSAVMALVLGAAGTASASPDWAFNGVELPSGSTETVVGAAISSSLSIPGATTECKHFLYSMKISNSGGKGKGELTEVPLFECTTSATACTVSGIEAEKLPWPVHLETIGSSDYLIVEKVRVTIDYSGKSCAVAGETVVKGSAGGIIENSSEKAKFDSETFTTTKTSLGVGATPVEWKGEFPTEAFEKHREEKLEA